MPTDVSGRLKQPKKSRGGVAFVVLLVRSYKELARVSSNCLWHLFSKVQMLSPLFQLENFCTMLFIFLFLYVNYRSSSAISFSQLICWRRRVTEGCCPTKFWREARALFSQPEVAGHLSRAPSSFACMYHTYVPAEFGVLKEKLDPSAVCITFFI